MGRPKDDEEYIEPFSRRLERVINKRNFSQTDLARESEVAISYITDMKQGDRLTPTPVLKCIKGLIKLNEITTPDEVNYWLFSFADETGRKYIHVEELGKQGEELLRLIKEAQERREKALQKAKYETIQRIPVIGRDQDIQEILSKLQDEEIHFLAFVGLPGVGKTELVRQVGIEAEAQGYYVRTFPLAQETSPDAVIKLLMDTLAVIPKRRRTLVILDNCEQIKGLRQALNKFLDEHKHIVILATSRKRMTRSDFPVKQLRAPETRYEPIDTLQTYDSVKLFLASINVRRAEDNRFKITEDNAQKIAHLCSALGGLPLMLVMAGSWVDELDLEKVYSDFLSADLYTLKYSYYENAHHISLDRVIWWSYNQLQPDEQKLFRRLGIFAGGCSQETAATICNLNDDLPTANPNFTNIILALINHHLVTYTNRRIEIAHNTIRDYARRKLHKEKDGEEEKILLRRHRDFFLTRAKAATSAMVGWTMSPHEIQTAQSILGSIARGELVTTTSITYVKEVFSYYEMFVKKVDRHYFWRGGIDLHLPGMPAHLQQKFKYLKEQWPHYCKEDLIKLSEELLSIITSPMMQELIAEHENFNKAFKWTIQAEGVNGIEAFAYLDGALTLPSFYCDLIKEDRVFDRELDKMLERGELPNDFPYCRRVL